MGSFYFNVSHRGSVIPEDSNVFFDNLTNRGWTNKYGMALVLLHQGATKVLRGFFRVDLEGATPADAFLKIIAAINSTSTAAMAFYFRYRNVDATTNKDTDSSSWDETKSNQTVVGSGTVKEYRGLSVDLTHGNFADGDLCEFEFGIDGANNACGQNLIVFSAMVQIDV